MKVLYPFFFALLLTASTAHLHEVPTEVLAGGSAIDNLIRSALEYIRKLLIQHEPLHIPDNLIPEQDIHDDESKIYLLAHLTDVVVSKASSFKVDHIENSLLGLWGKFGLSMPSIHVEGNYDLKGTAVGKAVSGQGSFTAELTNLVTNGFVQIEIIDHSLQVKDLKINYTVEDFKFKEEGLVVEGVTEEQLENMFNTALLKFFQDNEEMVCGKIARQVKIEANQIMKGKTLQELIDWLKHFGQ